MISERPEWWSSDDWATPPEVVSAVVAEYGAFDLDACAREATAKAPLFYTQETNGLASPWFGRVWVNPPYSNPKPWVARAVKAIQAGEARQVIMLLPAATDTGWFHEYVLPYADVRFIRGRIKFLGWEGTPIGSPKAGNILAVYPKTSVTWGWRP